VPGTIDVTYEITCADGPTTAAVGLNRENIGPQHIDPQRIAREIALEQTVELPDGFALSREIETSIVGRVVEVVPLPESKSGPLATSEKPPSASRYRAIIAYNSDIAAGQLPQFLNLLYGNISIKNFIKVTDVKLPAEFLENFRGPLYGIEGIRRLTGVYGRPLLATALKPMGMSPGELAATAAAFAEGGGDIVKDDHGLVDHPFCPFRERTARVAEAVERVNARTGRRTLYFPNVLAPSGRRDENNIERQVSYAASLGIRGVLMSPFLVGPDVVRAVSRDFNMAIMTHPAFTGTLFADPLHGITPDVLLGTVFRLAGADISVFPNYGGRFGFSRDDCRAIDEKLKAPLGALRPALPAPAGGMTLERIPEMAALYGPDAVYLIGGALLGLSQDVAANTRVFMDKILEHFIERGVRPPASMLERPQISTSSCEMPETGFLKNQLMERLEFNDDFSWLGRSPQIYKTAGGEDSGNDDFKDVDFKNITRHELIGGFGEHTGFELRYFQIEPGGFSSLEKHVHEHAIVCIRGAGTLTVGDNTYNLKPFDAAYVPPLAVHRLANDFQSEPLGFLCIVDKVRDRPSKP
jgi:ribulose-bisphosphate carboxylase large chain